MTTQAAMNLTPLRHLHPHHRRNRAEDSSGEPSESTAEEPARPESMEDGEWLTASSSSSRPEPTRGIKKTPSLRRGAAAYAQLLRSAVMASIEAQAEASCVSGAPPAPLSPDAMPASSTPSRGNKRTRHPTEVMLMIDVNTPSKACNGRRHRDEDDMDDMEI